MLQEYYVDNYNGPSAGCLLVLRQSIWNRSVRDYLLTGRGCEGFSFCQRDGETGSFREVTGGKGVLTVLSIHRILNSTGKSPEGKAARKLCDSADFRELCRIFGERFAGVRAFELKYELSFCESSEGAGRILCADNMLSYMRVEITCEKAYGEDRTAFFEILRYRGGDNYDLFWDGFPDVMMNFSDGHAGGCNVFMRGLMIYDIQTDGIPEGVQFAMILPVIIAFSRIAAAQFDYVIPLKERMRYENETCSENDGKVFWANPDNEIRYTGRDEGIDIWKRYYGGFAGKEQVALVRAVLSQKPGETLVVPAGRDAEGLSDFLIKQGLVYKKIVQL